MYVEPLWASAGLIDDGIPAGRKNISSMVSKEMWKWLFFLHHIMEQRQSASLFCIFSALVFEKQSWGIAIPTYLRFAKQWLQTLSYGLEDEEILSPLHNYFLTVYKEFKSFSQARTFGRSASYLFFFPRVEIMDI